MSGLLHIICEACLIVRLLRLARLAQHLGHVILASLLARVLASSCQLLVVGRSPVGTNYRRDITTRLGGRGSCCPLEDSVQMCERDGFKRRRHNSNNNHNHSRLSRYSRNLPSDDRRQQVRTSKLAPSISSSALASNSSRSFACYLHAHLQRSSSFAALSLVFYVRNKTARTSHSSRRVCVASSWMQLLLKVSMF